MWIDFFSQEIKRKILLTSKSVNFWWDKNRKITFWVYHLHPALCASPPQIPILPQSNLPKRCYETHCIGNMHMVTYQTYLDAERPRKLPPLVQMLSTSDPTTLHHHCLGLLPWFFGYLCDCVDLQVNIIGRYLLSLDDLNPEAPSCVFYATCCKVHWKFETVDGDSSTLIWYQTLTNTHAEHTQGPKGW